MAIYENYNNSSLGQRMAAVGGCIIGGAIVLFLGLMGAFGDYETLHKMGINGWTIPFYLVIVVCGFLILMRMRYAAIVAACAGLAEIVCYVCMQLSTTPEVSFLVLLKIAVIFCSAQLCVAIYSFNDEENDEEIPEPRHHVGPQPPQGRQVVRHQAPLPRNQAPVGRNQPPRPKR